MPTAALLGSLCFFLASFYLAADKSKVIAIEKLDNDNKNNNDKDIKK